MNEKGEPIINIEKCIGCRRCIKVCPVNALEMYYTPEEQKILAEIAALARAKEVSIEKPEAFAGIKEYRGVWVFVEHTEGKPAVVSWNFWGAGAKLAKTLGAGLCSVLSRRHG